MKLRTRVIVSAVGLVAAFTLFTIATPGPQTATAQSAERNTNAVAIIDCRRTESSGPKMELTAWSGSKNVAPIVRGTGCATAMHQLLERGFDLRTSDSATNPERSANFVTRYVFIRP